MTSRPIAPTPNTEKIVQFPDPPPEEMTAFYDVNFPAYPASLSLHFGNRETTIITSELATGLRPTESYQGILFPDLLVAFHVDPQAEVARKGYLTPEQGKPPDFVMEVASETTARRDETVKRDAYASMRVGEYWRFDPTGGQQYQTALAGDRLAGGVYEPISIHRTDEGHYWGHSEALNLALCWEDGNLRFWDPVSGSYLPTFEDERADHLAEASARRAAEAHAEVEANARRAAESRAEAETNLRRAAEAQVRRLEEELRRRQDP